MKLINDIIELLSSEQGNLTNALIKTKVLLHKLGEKQLIGWVNNELNGYEDTDEVPPYRVVPAQVMANLASIAWQVAAHPIPIAHLTEDQQKDLQEIKMRGSLAVLEKFGRKSKGHLESPIPLEANHALGESLADGVHIQRAWCQVENGSITQILIKVRSRLLDFILELSEKFGDELDEEQLRERIATVDTKAMFNNAMFGDNVTIVMGDSSHANVSNVAIRGDFNSLAQELQKHNVSEEDIKVLQQAISDDDGKTVPSKREFGPAVKEWLRKMLTKAAEATWQVDIIVAGFATQPTARGPRLICEGNLPWLTRS